MPLQYSGGTVAQPSTIDKASGKAQFNTFYHLKKSIIEARREQYFMPLASTIGMPKHFGKTIKVYEYVPLLDVRNVNDQGIDAAGVTLDPTRWRAYNAAGDLVKAGAGIDATNYSFATQAAALTAAGAGGKALQEGGNLYGSSKDIGAIGGKLPVLSENGGRVNRVGFTRLSREGSIAKFGFFHEWTKESQDFDSDEELGSHLARELMNGAVQLTEAVLQKDLLAAAGTVVYAGPATADNLVTGEAADPDDICVVTYQDLMRLDQILTDNRTPKQTKVITGSRLVDTKTIPAGRVMFVGSELVPHLKGMKDLFNNKAFVDVQHYADAGTVLNGEIGSIDAFRIVLVPEMLHWAGVGAAETGANPGYRATAGKYDVYPMLVIGDDSFTTIGFQTDGKTLKFSVITKMPGAETADKTDPYGEQGFSSIKWYYGVLIKRPERIGLVKTVAPV